MFHVISLYDVSSYNTCKIPLSIRKHLFQLDVNVYWRPINILISAEFGQNDNILQVLMKCIDEDAVFTITYISMSIIIDYASYEKS